MTTQHVTIELPTPLYERLRQRAEAANRTVEDELLEVVATAAAPDDLSADLERALASLAVLDDASLWGAARTRMPAQAAAELEALHHKRQREGITSAEAQTAAALIQQYERTMLVRAEAASQLRDRGYDVSSLLEAT